MRIKSDISDYANKLRGFDFTHLVLSNLENVAQRIRTRVVLTSRVDTGLMRSRWIVSPPKKLNGVFYISLTNTAQSDEAKDRGHSKVKKSLPVSVRDLFRGEVVRRRIKGGSSSKFYAVYVYRGHRVHTKSGVKFVEGDSSLNEAIKRVMCDDFPVIFGNILKGLKK